MLFLLNTLCTNTDYTQNNARIINHTLYTAVCFKPTQKMCFARLQSHILYLLNSQYNFVSLYLTLVCGIGSNNVFH